MRLHITLVSVVALLLLGTQAHAAGRFALVVANAAYKDAPLGNPAVDARLIKPALEAAGFKVTLVLDADLSRFDSAVETFAEQAKQADIALFYFAGHGFAVNDGLAPRNYLMSTDAQLGSASERLLKAGGIPLDEIAQRVGGAAKVTLVFVDACRNDPRRTRGSGGTRGLARIEATGIPNLFIGISTRLGEQALDGPSGSGSPFAHAFAKEISRPGLRIDDAFAAIRREVSTDTAQQQKPEIVQDDLDMPLILVSPKEEPAVPPPDLQASLPRPAATSEPAPSGPVVRSSGLSYSGLMASSYSGADSVLCPTCRFIGSWISILDARIDGQPLSRTIAFEITGNYREGTPDTVDYSIGISDIRTVRRFDPVYANKTNIGNRFFINRFSIKSGRWKKVFLSADKTDQRILAGMCRSLSLPLDSNPMMKRVAEASSLWQVPRHLAGIAALGRSCYGAVEGVVKPRDEVFVSEK